MTITDKLQVAAFVTSLIAQTAFLLVYWRRPWRDYLAGRALMELGAVLWFLFAIPLVGVWLNYPGKEWVEAVIYWMVPFAIGNKIRSMLKLKKVRT